ncbi:hypothetical protein DV735_g1767, partial [Chaetothyriales sp. CBS 134920]
MSEPEIATKAPELGDIDTYITKPASYPSVPAPLLLLLTGGTGIHSPNNQRQADKYASAGFVVVMPDHIKLKAVETAKSFLIDMWLARQTPEKVLPRLRKVLEAARDEYADCLAHSGGGIYAAGYCFGAKYVLILAAGDKETTGSSPSLPPLKAGAVAHATLVTRADVRGIKAPVSIVAVENDPLFPDEILEIGRKHLATSAISHEVKVYPGVPHGFAVLGDYADPHIREQQEKAFAQMLGWLKSH